MRLMTKAIRPQRIDKTAPIFALKHQQPTAKQPNGIEKSQQRSCLSTHLWLNKRFIRHKEGHREANATESLSEKAALIGISNFYTCKTQGVASPQNLSNVGVSKNMGKPPKSSILIGFSIIFTIHFGVPLFLETPILLYVDGF